MSMLPVQRFLGKLKGVKQVGKGWQARCPAHRDRRPSLSIDEGDDGRALVKCFAGCTVDAICKAVDLRVADLMPTTDLPPVRPRVNKSQNPAKRHKTFSTPDEALAELERQHGPRSALWLYHHADGEPVGVVVRWDRPDGNKDIRPISRHDDGRRIGGIPEPRPLYALPDLPQANRVFICEGEKAADAVRSLGLVATTSLHGCESANKTDWTPLAGKEVIVLPDNDPPGEKYADAVLGILATLTSPPSIKLVRLPDLPEHGDAADWVASGGTREELIRLADAADVWTPAVKPEPGPIITCLADVEPREVAWLWPRRIPLGRITLLVGRPGEGKSFLTTDMAARVTTGTAWPEGSDCPQGSVVFIAAEDDPADTIRPRLDAHGADVRRVHLLSAVRRSIGDEHIEKMITLADVDAIESALKKLNDCRLVIVDPIGSFLGSGTDAHRDNEVRGVLAPIAALAEKYGPAVLVVAHRRKSAGTNADDTALGSRAFTGIARAVWHLTRDAENKDRRLLLPGKNNLADEGDGLAFSIVGEPARIEWEPDPVNMNADDGLLAALTDGPRLAKDLFDEWTNDQGGSERTLKRAKEALGVEADRLEVPGPWWWRLPTQGGQVP